MSATNRNPFRNSPMPGKPSRKSAGRMRLVAAAVLIASLFGPLPVRGLCASPVVAEKTTATVDAGMQPRAASAANATLGTSPEDLARRDVDSHAPSVAELLNPASRVWAEAPALALRYARPRLLLAEGVLAHAGNGKAAAASRSDGSILLFAPVCGPAPCVLNMPGGHPAFALGLSGDGSVLVAWSQGTGEFVFFDQTPDKGQAQGMSLRIAAPLAGGAMLAMSPDGQALAAYDGAGALWAGVRGGEMRPLGGAQGTPILVGFSAGGGVLVTVEASGAGRVWNPRTGKPLRSFSVPGGPFVRGELSTALGTPGEAGLRLRLWTADRVLVRWDVLRGGSPPEADAGAENGSGGSLQQRGQDLFYVGSGRSWTAIPDYEPLALGLSWSKQQRCLRLRDLDGVVRYYSSENGAPTSQCFAVDWSPVEIRPDGTARLPGQTLRLFDVVAQDEGGRQINARAISSTSIRLWTSRTPAPSGGSAASNSERIAVLRDVADGQGLSIPLRDGISDQPATRVLRLGR